MLGFDMRIDEIGKVDLNGMARYLASMFKRVQWARRKSFGMTLGQKIVDLVVHMYVAKEYETNKYMELTDAWKDKRQNPDYDMFHVNVGDTINNLIWRQEGQYIEVYFQDPDLYERYVAVENRRPILKDNEQYLVGRFKRLVNYHFRKHLQEAGLR